MGRTIEELRAKGEKEAEKARKQYLKIDKRYIENVKSYYKYDENGIKHSELIMEKLINCDCEFFNL